MINFSTTNIIIAYYPSQAGGKFLLNCLGLSNQVVLQDCSIAQAQLNGVTSSTDKFNLLINRINHSKNIKKIWNDLDLGCKTLFGTPSAFDPNLFHPVIDHLSQSSLLFPVVAHNLNTLISLSKIWPNAKILHLINEKKFIQTYRPTYCPKSADHSQLEIAWSNIRSESWPEFAPDTVDDYNLLPDFIKQEDQQLHSHAILMSVINHENIMKKLSSTETKHWNCNWFLNVDIFKEKIQHLYKEFELTDFSEDKIMAFYLAWIDCLDALKFNKINDLVTVDQ